jgi:hypothetical protein
MRGEGVQRGFFLVSGHALFPGGRRGRSGGLLRCDMRAEAQHGGQAGKPESVFHGTSSSVIAHHRYGDA